MTDEHTCKTEMKVEDLAEMIARTDQAVALATTYSQMAHEVGFLGNGLRLKVPFSDFIETLQVWWMGSHEIHVDSLLCADDTRACIMALNRAGQAYLEHWELDESQLEITIPSMTPMGVEA